MNKLIPWLLVLIAVTLIFGQAAGLVLLGVMVGVIALGFVVLCLIKWSDVREKKKELVRAELLAACKQMEASKHEQIDPTPSGAATNDQRGQR